MKAFELTMFLILAVVQHHQRDLPFEIVTAQTVSSTAMVEKNQTYVHHAALLLDFQEHGFCNVIEVEQGPYLWCRLTKGASLYLTSANRRNLSSLTKMLPSCSVNFF